MLAPMKNYEVLELATMRVMPERDLDGKSTKFITFDILIPVVERQPINHGVRRDVIVQNPTVKNCGHKWKCSHDFHWFLTKEAEAWCRACNAEYTLHWSELRHHAQNWASPRNYELRITFNEPKHAMMFKLAFGGAKWRV